jgi:hypothetical protein
MQDTKTQTSVMAYNGPDQRMTIRRAMHQTLRGPEVSWRVDAVREARYHTRGRETAPNPGERQDCLVLTA